MLIGVPRLLAQEPAAPPREYSVPKKQIPESFLGYLVGLIDADVQFSLDSQGLLEVLPEFKGRSGDPFQLLEEVARREDSGRSMTLSFRFPDDLRIPLPLGIFGYHPISVYVSRSIVLVERRYPWRSVGGVSGGLEPLSPDYEYRVSEGYARFQFDDWLVFLSGGALQDFAVRGVAIFRDRGEWRAHFRQRPGATGGLLAVRSHAHDAHPGRAASPARPGLRAGSLTKRRTWPIGLASEDQAPPGPGRYRAAAAAVGLP